MISVITSIFSDYTLRTVIMGSGLLGVISGTLGCFAVLRQRSMLGDTISHAALPGIALAFLLTGSKSPLTLLTGAALAGWSGTWVIVLVTSRTRIKADGAQGIVLSVFFGLGIVLLSWIQRLPSASKAGLDKFLFGQAATLMTEDIVITALVGAVILLLLVLFWKEVKILTFDADYTASLGFPARRLEYLMTLLIVAAIVIGLQTVGVVLMSAMVVAPGASARQWTNRLGVMVVFAGLIGALAGIVGGAVSANISNMPTGPAIVIVLGILAAFSFIAAPGRGLIARELRRMNNRRIYAADRILVGLVNLDHRHGNTGHPHSSWTLRVLNPERPRSVDGALKALKIRGLVVRDVKGRWALTSAGRAYEKSMGKPLSLRSEGAGP